MQIHQLNPTHKFKKAPRVGRGGKRGTFSGRGAKGQNARAGAKMMPMIREMIKRYPKLRGYRYGGIPKHLAVVNLDTLEAKFEGKDVITPELLVKKRIVRRIEGNVPTIKILGKGELKKALSFENCKFSETAKKAVEKAGGTIK